VGSAGVHLVPPAVANVGCGGDGRCCTADSPSVESTVSVAKVVGKGVRLRGWRSPPTPFAFTGSRRDRRRLPKVEARHVVRPGRPTFDSAVGVHDGTPPMVNQLGVRHKLAQAQKAAKLRGRRRATRHLGVRTVHMLGSRRNVGQRRVALARHAAQRWRRWQRSRVNKCCNATKQRCVRLVHPAGTTPTCPVAWTGALPLFGCPADESC